MRKYPDQKDVRDVISRFRLTSVLMGGVSFSSVLTFEVTRQGLRLKMNRIFGPFARPIFIPWKEIRVERGNSFGEPSAWLYFGSGGGFPRLELFPEFADDLWRSAGEMWPEKGDAPAAPSPTAVLQKYLKYWAGLSVFASVFFLFFHNVTRVSRGEKMGPESLLIMVVLVLFPAIVLGVTFTVMYFQETGRRKKLEEERLYRE